MLQEAIGDCKVPNVGAELLAREMGIAQLTPAHEAIHGLDQVAAPATTSAIAQFTLPENLARYTPATTNTVPVMDNMVHGGVYSLPAAVAQAVTVLRDGRIELGCEGECDPD